MQFLGMLGQGGGALGLVGSLLGAGSRGQGGEDTALVDLMEATTDQSPISQAEQVLGIRQNKARQLAQAKRRRRVLV
jgi:hypothetical protein